MSIYTLMKSKFSGLLIFAFTLLFATVAHAQISVTATAGTVGPTVYTTLNGAVNAINAGTHQGVINVSVTANTTETVQSVLNSSGTGSSVYSAITIKPAAATTPTITGNIATSSILQLNGADNVTIDGSNTAGGTTRDLTITNTNTGTVTVLWIVSASAADGATNNVIKNCKITGFSAGTTVAGILTGSSTVGAAALTANSNNTIQNNLFSNTQNGIYLFGVATAPYDLNWNITGNSFLTLGFRGMILQNAGSFTISNNIIDGVSANTASCPTGIQLTSSFAGGNIYNNSVGNVNNTAATFGCNGIFLDATTTASNINVYNNFVYNIWSTTGWTGGTGFGDNGYGIIIDLGGGYNLYNNTIQLITNSTAGLATAAINITNAVTTAGSVIIKNNIIVNSQTSGSTRYGVYCTAANTIFPANGMDYNDYYSVSPNLGRIGGVNRTTIAAMQTGFGGNVNSITPYLPAFVSTVVPYDLHLTTAAANNVLATGTPIGTPAITTDIDGNTRSTTFPTMGADEIVANNISYTLLPTTTCSTGDVALNGVTITSGVGVPTTGVTVPQIYFRKNAGAWFHSSGTLASGTASSGTWNFNITAGTMGGVAGTDVITYYVIAQTTAGAVFANPSAGLVATDVNTVTTAPTTPNSYTVIAVSLTGLTTSAIMCYNTATATVNYIYTGSLSTPNQYTLTWLPAGGPADITAFTALPASPLTVTVPGGTAANTYTGTLTIKNSTTGCTNTYTLTLIVNPPPSPILGLFTLCTGGFTTTLTDLTAGGTWSGGSPAVATISATGQVTSVGVGTTIVSYTAPITGCSDTALITVISAPNSITGPTTVCVGGIMTLSETTLGGSWSSGTIARSTVDAASGAVYGVSTGPVTISYIMPSGCYVVYPITVNAAMPAITGSTAVCAGSTISLANTATGGTWTSGTTAAATVSGAGTIGTVGGVASGSSAITYAVSVGCSASTTITVNPLPSPISGPSGVCAGGATISLTDASGTGSWSSSGPSATATITSGGVVTGGTTGSVTITYTLPVTGCYVTTPITVNPLPLAITGASAVCENGATVTVADASGTGSWSGGPGTALTIDAAGTITGVGAGAGTVTYTLPITGCYVTRAITVNPLPAAIGGTPVVCLNQSTLLTDASAPGTWSSSNANVTMGSPAGTMTGAAVGTANITYTLNATGCYVSVPATVNPLPAPIGGATTTVCGGGATITLTETTTGGTWSSGATATATVDAGGVVYGVAAGVVAISYTITATGCSIATNVTVLPIPNPIGGALSVCEAGDMTTLTNTTTPGTWSITPATIATITSAGVVTGVNAGIATVSYTGSNACSYTAPFQVKPLPSAIAGTLSVCQTSVTTLSSTPGGTWTVGNPFVATVSSGGGVTGLTPGTSTITYTLPTGCKTATSVIVNSIPGPITGSAAICINGISTLSNAVGGGTWSSSNTTNVTIDASGVAHGVAIGPATISYTTGTSGCYVILPVNVTSIVVPSVTVNASPSTTICAGDTVTFSGTIVNGGSAPLYVWSINNVILSGASTYTYHPADGDLVRLWILSNYGCAVPDTASNWVTMTVHPIVTPAVSLSIPGGDTVCSGAFTTINAIPVAGGTAPTYQWYVNLGFVGTSSSYGYIPANGDVVTAILNSNAFCRTATTATATKTLTVSNLITPFVSINSSLGLTTCEGYPEIFTTNMIGGGTAPTYQWAVNGVNTVAGPIFSYPPVNGDNVQVTMTSNFPCVTTPFATANETITVLPITQPVGVITAQPGYIIPAGMNDTFTITLTSGGGTAPTYQWFIDNIPITGATNTVFITNTLLNGDSVSCAVTNTDQCSGVSVFTSLTIAIGTNVGVHELNQNGVNLSLLPNPNNGSFTIKGDLGIKNNEEVTLNITDVLGRKVYSNTAKTVNGEINTQILLNGALANGQYILNVQSEHVSKVFHFVLEQ
ncbi:hypothetical protein CJD36_019295 [Flavipsychrobacter stenotrophus]|uniref:Secretion system C-terminal sorting domain-containing protein n=1 Tax=Flavipsychrobacter stenotrophus TaxID=2077091 RepID=A0A2S7SRY5_9BACT|nr:T9SS type A sorting domain-containing protein [Flavipsychrobacter stenotrophus]PQJ09391.1 hypothetical protein CJD36_019295 [Flavipsychrobacter stenotrophus]